MNNLKKPLESVDSTTPVFFKADEAPDDVSVPEICMAAEGKIGHDRIAGAVKKGNLWRIHGKRPEDKASLLATKGPWPYIIIQRKEHGGVKSYKIRLYAKNPISSTLDENGDVIPTTKLCINGFLLSVSNEDIRKSLEKIGVKVISSKVYYDRAWLENRKLSRFVNGSRYAFIAEPSVNNPIPRNLTVGFFKGTLWYKGMPKEPIRCWDCNGPHRRGDKSCKGKPKSQQIMTHVENNGNVDNVENIENVDNIENVENVDNGEKDNVDSIESDDNGDSIERGDNVDSIVSEDNVDSVERNDSVDSIEIESEDNVDSMEHTDNVDGIENDDNVNNIDYDEDKEVENNHVSYDGSTGQSSNGYLNHEAEAEALLRSLRINPTCFDDGDGDRSDGTRSEVSGSSGDGKESEYDDTSEDESEEQNESSSGDSSLKPEGSQIGDNSIPGERVMVDDGTNNETIFGDILEMGSVNTEPIEPESPNMRMRGEAGNGAPQDGEHSADGGPKSGKASSNEQQSKSVWGEMFLDPINRLRQRLIGTEKGESAVETDESLENSHVFAHDNKDTPVKKKGNNPERSKMQQAITDHFTPSSMRKRQVSSPDEIGVSKRNKNNDLYN